MKFCNYESILISYVFLENVSTLKNVEINKTIINLSIKHGDSNKRCPLISALF